MAPRSRRAARRPKLSVVPAPRAVFAEPEIRRAMAREVMRALGRAAAREWLEQQAKVKGTEVS